MSLIKLDAHYLNETGVGAVGLTITLANGTTVIFPAPFVPLTASLAVMPWIRPDDATGLRIDFAFWAPMTYGDAGAARFPLSLPTQELAVRVTRAFDADPATAWSDSPDQMVAWLRSWAASNDVPLTV
ncbi:hypothetical protein ACWEOG_03720 [Amycolatopsis japonica]